MGGRLWAGGGSGVREERRGREEGSIMLSRGSWLMLSHVGEQTLRCLLALHLDEQRGSEISRQGSVHQSPSFTLQRKSPIDAIDSANCRNQTDVVV